MTISFDSIAYTPAGQPLTYVADEYNALNNGNSDIIGFTAGYWTASIPTVSTTPLPAALPLFATGLGGLGFLSWRRKKKAQAAA